MEPLECAGGTLGFRGTPAKNIALHQAHSHFGVSYFVNELQVRMRSIFTVKRRIKGQVRRGSSQGHME